MRVAIAVDMSSDDDVRFVLEAERLGVDAVWVPEAWGYDALTPLAFLAARTERIRLASGIVQVGARTPAMLAMQAMSLQRLSGGRFELGLGSSGPRIMEAWHGIAFPSPIPAMRETIEIVRSAAAGERLDHRGEVYSVPLDGAGRGIRSSASPTEVPIHIAALGPRMLELTGECADGWLGNAFIAEHAEVFIEPLRRGAQRAGRDLSDIAVTMPVAVEFDDDLERVGRKHANGYAFTIGAMGAPDRNFYSRAFARQGFADEVQVVSDLWSQGRREEAAAAVPIEIGLHTNLVGPEDYVRERVRADRDAGVTTLQAKTSGSVTERLDTVGRLLDLVGDVTTSTRSD